MVLTATAALQPKDETAAFIGRSNVVSDTVFQAASLGKVAAAYAALIPVEQGKVALDQRLTDPRIRVPEGCSAPSGRLA